jgi:hypothetical protein
MDWTPTRGERLGLWAGHGRFTAWTSFLVFDGAVLRK